MPPRKRKQPDPDSPPPLPESEQFLFGTRMFIVNAGIEKMRQQIFQKQLKRYGGILHDQLKEDTTHIVVDDKMDSERLCRILKTDSLPADDISILKSAWLSKCFKLKEMVEEKEYKLEICLPSKNVVNKLEDKEKSDEERSKKEDERKSNQDKPAKVGFMFGAYKKPKLDLHSDNEDSDYQPSDHEADYQEEVTGIGATSSGNPDKSEKKNHDQLPTGSWVCAQSSKNVLPNYNKHITDKLEEMVKTYKSTSDTWRAYGYQKAIQVLRKHPKPISTWEEARSLPQVGSRLADKIWEIAESGELRKLNEFKSSEDVKIMEMFGNVWGAGAHTSRTWYQQGFRTLEDLRTKANLTHQQKVGLKHYDDILDRMPREEAGEIEQVVREAAESLVPGIIAQACGSYRRGRATCGDVDVLVTHPDGKSHKLIFSKLLAKLKEKGFLTDDLVTAEDNGNQKKYLGVCKLPGENRRHRRLDIIVVPYNEYACSLVYFTGSAHFNRSLRHLAKKMNMSLSEHSLNTGVVRKGNEKIYEGTPVPTPTEESVFQQLGVPLRPPEERDH